MLSTIENLNLGFSDAQNYTLRANKQMLSEVFVKNSYLTKLLNCYMTVMLSQLSKLVVDISTSHTEKRVHPI